MKKCSSVVWRFFDRLEEHKRCVAVLCKLCDTQYKYFGNTTNLRAHLINKHPIQWELSQNGTLDETHFKIEDDDTNQSTPKRRKYVSRGRKDKNVDVLANSESDNDHDEDNSATLNLVRQMHAGGNSDEEWLENDPYQITHIETYEPKKKKMKYKKIKREVASPAGLPGFYVAPKPHKTIIYDDSQIKDEYSVFGEYVANKLRKFKAPRTRGNLQQLITTILWQAEYGLYDRAEAVKRVLMYSIQTPDTEPEPEPEPETQAPVDYEEQMQAVHEEEIIELREDPIQSNEGDLGVIN